MPCTLYIFGNVSKYIRMQHYCTPQEKVRYFIFVVDTIFRLTITMCDRGCTITHLQNLRFHTMVWYDKKYRWYQCEIFKIIHTDITAISWLADFLVTYTVSPLQPYTFEKSLAFTHPHCILLFGCFALTRSLCRRFIANWMQCPIWLVGFTVKYR